MNVMYDVCVLGMLFVDWVRYVRNVRFVYWVWCVRDVIV